MPFQSNGKRDYLREKLWESPARRKQRAMRNSARKKMGLKVGDSRQVDHKRNLSSGGTNAKSNLRVISAKSNSRKEALRKGS